MSKRKEPVITVRVIYAGKQTDREAFINLILAKEKERRAAEGYGEYYAFPPPRAGVGTRRRTQTRNRE